MSLICNILYLISIRHCWAKNRVNTQVFLQIDYLQYEKRITPSIYDNHAPTINKEENNNVIMKLIDRSIQSVELC